jgi:hypothetical protein
LWFAIDQQNLREDTMTSKSVAVCESALHLDWQQLDRAGTPLSQRAELVRIGLDDKGVVILSEFIRAEDMATMKADLLRSKEKMKPSSGGKKYSLKYDDISDHAVVRMASSAEMLCFINAIISVSNPIASRVLESADVQVGYSITQGVGDFVSFHYDTRNVINCIVPIIMPTADGSASSYLWAWPNLVGFTPTFKDRVRSRALLTLLQSRLGSRMQGHRYEYREGHAVLFYGSRTLHGVRPTNIDGLRVVASINYRWPTEAAVKRHA